MTSMCVHNIFNPPCYCYCCYVVVDRHEMGMLPGYLLDVMTKLKQGDHAAAVELVDDMIDIVEQMTLTAKMTEGVLPADPRAADQRAAAEAWQAANGPAPSRAP